MQEIWQWHMNIYPKPTFKAERIHDFNKIVSAIWSSEVDNSGIFLANCVVEYSTYIYVLS